MHQHLHGNHVLLYPPRLASSFAMSSNTERLRYKPSSFAWIDASPHILIRSSTSLSLHWPAASLLSSTLHPTCRAELWQMSIICRWIVTYQYQIRIKSALTVHTAVAFDMYRIQYHIWKWSKSDFKKSGLGQIWVFILLPKSLTWSLDPKKNRI